MYNIYLLLLVGGERNEVKYKLHDCSRCGKMEEVVKSFKRCIKCRGKPNPKYYCTKECQGNKYVLYIILLMCV